MRIKVNVSPNPSNKLFSACQDKFGNKAFVRNSDISSATVDRSLWEERVREYKDSQFVAARKFGPLSGV